MPELGTRQAFASQLNNAYDSSAGVSASASAGASGSSAAAAFAFALLFLRGPSAP